MLSAFYTQSKGLCSFKWIFSSKLEALKDQPVMTELSSFSFVNLKSCRTSLERAQRKKKIYKCVYERSILIY